MRFVDQQRSVVLKKKKEEEQDKEKEEEEEEEDIHFVTRIHCNCEFLLYKIEFSSEKLNNFYESGKLSKQKMK